MTPTDRRNLGLDLGRIAVAITDITGHRQGTFQHEAMFGRVVANLANSDPAPIRDDSRETTTVLHRADFERAEVTA